ncbi:MAG: transmembrane anchor protein, partial [Gemmatimonadota bacterium]|nr:transmembrane anchor protein [Gemmatimonadota bacterium]
PPATANSHVTDIELAPNQGKEIKLVMRKDARVTFSWSTDRGVVNYDTHADAPGIRYHGYGKGTGKQSDEGVLVAAFDGAHGWFWRNRGSEAVTVTLRTNGDYQELKRM